MQGLLVDPAVLQDCGVMDGVRIPSKGVNEAALPITYCLQLYGREELPVELILGTGFWGGLDADMEAISSAHTLGKH